MPLHAVRFIRTAECGSSHPSLVEASDSLLYWVKFQGNPQGSNTLVSEFIATRLAALVGLPVPCPLLIEVEQAFIDRHPAMHYPHPRYGIQKPFPGPQLAIPHVSGNDAGTDEARVANAVFFAGGLAFDVWTRQEDRRQAIYGKGPADQVTFIDFGRAFAPDALESPMEFEDGGRAPFCSHFDYQRLTQIKDFEPWLTRIENLSKNEIAACVDGVPLEWFEVKSEWEKYAFEMGDREEFDPSHLNSRVEWMFDRCRSIRCDLEAEIAASSDYFPYWMEPFSELALQERERRAEIKQYESF
jgi:hypothetical protein